MLRYQPPSSCKCTHYAIFPYFPIVFFSLICFLAISNDTNAEHRVFVLTDIENEPDDAMSMVRFLVYANHFDIEGLAATTSIHQQNKVATYRIREIVEAYAKVQDNLAQHEPGFPTADHVRSCITEGLPEYGVQAVGEGKDSPASEKLIAAVDKDDPRPLWVTVWGGPNVLAQALWKVRKTRTAEELRQFVAKLRVVHAQNEKMAPLSRESVDLGRCGG